MIPSLFRTLRFRLAAAFFVWTGLFLVLLGVALPLTREVLIRREVDTKLDEVEQNVLSEFRAAGLRDGEQLLRKYDYDLSEVMIQVDPSPLPAAETAPASAVRLPLPAGDDSRRTVYARASVPKTTPERYRIAAHRVNYLGQDYLVQIGESLAQFDRIERTLIKLLMIALAIGLVATAIAGWIVSGSVVSRINKVARAVRDVSPTRLDERVQILAGNDEIGVMANDLNHMLERMAVAFRSQEKFMSEVSHELKTPLSALLTEAQVLKQMRNTPRWAAAPQAQAAAETRKAVEPYERFVLSVEEEMRWLGKLVESFLMLARFGHGKQFLAETTVPMNDIVLDATEHSSLYARQHGVNLNLSLYDAGEDQPEAVIRGDPQLLRVVADNLIRNAVQFSKKGDSVFIRLAHEGLPGSPGVLLFTVKDQGPGVPEEYLTRIFDRFAQAPSKGSTRRGSGLGLTIAKSIVDLHSGHIEANNDPAGGCIFSVRLPILVVRPDSPHIDKIPVVAIP